MDDETIRLNFGTTLTRFRKRDGMSQSELARRTGFDHSYVSRIENGTRTPSMAAIRKFTDVFNTPEDVDELMLSAGRIPVQIEDEATIRLAILMAHPILPRKDKAIMESMVLNVIRYGDLALKVASVVHKATRHLKEPEPII